MLSNKKWIVVVAILALAALVLGACAPATPATTEAPAATEAATTAPVATEAPAAASGQPFKVGLLSDLATTNYWSFLDTNNSVWQAYVMTWWYPGVMTYSDQRFDWIPALADGLPGDRTPEGADKCSVTAKLKKGLTWSDGEALTAKDVAFTANTARTLKLGNAWPSIYGTSVNLSDVQAVDDLTVKYIFASTCDKVGLSQWEFGAALGPVLPEHFWKPYVDKAAPGVLALTEPTAPADGASQADQDKYKADKDAYDTALAAAQQVLEGVEVDSKAVVFGPFTFNQWQKGAFVQNDARPDYYFSGVDVTEFSDGGYTESKSGAYDYTQGKTSGDKSLSYTTGPFVPNIIYNVYGDQNAAELALEKGDIDYIMNPISYAGGVKAKMQSLDGVTIESNPSDGWRYIQFNTQKKGAPMHDKAFRQAVTILIDREFIATDILQGSVFPAFSAVPEANGAWYNPDIPKLGYAADGSRLSRADKIAAAIKVLKDAGYSFEGGKEPSVTGDGARNQQVTTGGTLLMPDGTPVPQLVFLAPTAGYDPTRSTAAIWIESWLNEFGIPIKYEATAFNSILDAVFSGPSDKWDIYMLGYGLTPFPTYLYDFFNTNGGSNPGGYSTPEMDKLTSDFSAATDLATAKDLAFKIQALAAEDPSIVTLFSNPILDVHRNNIEWPYLKVLDGLAGTTQNGLMGSVKVKTSQ